ncbi:MAG: sigma-70 family RNA polymerase sigma factor [Hyphomonadaceae bacterium]
MRAMNEEELHALMVASMDGDEDAYRRLLAGLAANLRPFIRKRLFAGPDEAEDIVQEVLLAVHLKRHTYDPSLPLTAWIYAIARFKLTDHLRRKGRRGQHFPIEDFTELTSESDHEAGATRRDIERLLDRLPEKQRRSIQMVKLEERSVRETAEAFSMSESDVKVSVHRGLKTLARLLAQETGAVAETGKEHP